MDHEPVLLEEVIKILEPERGGAFIDATIDGGGHSAKILEHLPKNGLLVGMDQDGKMIEKAKIKFMEEGRLKLLSGNFGNIKEIAAPLADNFAGILFDLGLSIIQLKESGRGFTFQKDEPLVMTFKSAPGAGDLTAEEIVNKWSREDLQNMIKELGEDRFARKIAQAIVEARKLAPIKTTGDLSDIILRAVPKRYHYSRIHPATRTFQALRITVNNELEQLKNGLEGAWQILGGRGRIVVISYHSLEDRIVKKYFKHLADTKGAAILTKKPITPSREEVRANPHSRSAKLRAIQK